MSWRTTLQRVLPDSLAGKAGPAFGRTMDRLCVPPSSLLAGRDVPAARTALLPTVLVLQLGEASAEALAGTVAALTRLAVPVAGVRPVLVVDGPHLQAARRAGVPVDHVVPEGAWAARHPDIPYARYLAGRLSGLRQDYATDHLVTVGPDGWAGLDDAAVLALLRPPSRPALTTSRLHLLARLERLVDPA